MYIGSFLYFRAWLKMAFASICFGSSNLSAKVYWKYLPLGHLLFLRCDDNRPLIFVCGLVLLPIYTGILLMSPILYIPNIPASRVRILSRLNSYHLFSTGIFHLSNIIRIISATSIKIMSFK